MLSELAYTRILDLLAWLPDPLWGLVASMFDVLTASVFAPVDCIVHVLHIALG